MTKEDPLATFLPLVKRPEALGGRPRFLRRERGRGRDVDPLVLPASVSLDTMLEAGDSGSSSTGGADILLLVGVLGADSTLASCRNKTGGGELICYLDNFENTLEQIC